MSLNANRAYSILNVRNAPYARTAIAMISLYTMTFCAVTCRNNALSEVHDLGPNSMVQICTPRIVAKMMSILPYALLNDGMRKTQYAQVSVMHQNPIKPHCTYFT